MLPIDLDKLIPGSNYFRWRELLWCPKWLVYVFPTDEQYLNIISSVVQFDLVREYLGQPMTVVSGLRPMKYNDWLPPFGVNGSKLSGHKRGNAMDFTIKKIKCNKVRDLLEPVLDDFDICMERLTDSNWIHIDTDPPRKNTGRYFVPF